MENTIPQPAVATPEVSAPPIQVQQPQPPPQVTQMESGGGVMNEVTKPKMNYKDLMVCGFLIVLSIYGVVYYRAKLKAMEENPTVDEYDQLRGDVDEVKFNLQKALGKKYQTI